MLHRTDGRSELIRYCVLFNGLLYCVLRPTVGRNSDMGGFVGFFGPTVKLYNTK